MGAKPMLASIGGPDGPLGCRAMDWPVIGMGPDRRADRRRRLERELSLKRCHLLSSVARSLAICSMTGWLQGRADLLRLPFPFGVYNVQHRLMQLQPDSLNHPFTSALMPAMASRPQAEKRGQALLDRLVEIACHFALDSRQQLLRKRSRQALCCLGHSELYL